MDTIVITVGNELAALPVLQAAIMAYLGIVGAGDRFSRRVEVVIDEVFTNILEHNYLPGQHERVHLTIGIQNGFLALTMRFKGIPIDVDYLREFAENESQGMIANGGRGIGLHLIRNFVDRIEYKNLGRDGQEICIYLEIPTDNQSSIIANVSEKPCKQDSEPLKVSLRRMLPSEAATVSKLAYLAYDYSYLYEHIYDPQKVRELNENDKLISFVAVTEKNEIIGHFALSRDDRSELLEMCSGFTDPGFRGSGSMNAMAAHGIEQAQKLGAGGVYVIAVTTHPYSQKAALNHGLKETALFVSCVQAFALRAIQEDSLRRESFLFMLFMFKNQARGPYYCPAQHRSMIERICRHAGLEAVFTEQHSEAPLRELGDLDILKDNYHQKGHVFINSYGHDTLSQVQRCLRLWQLDRLEVIYLYLPLSQPSTAIFCQSFEEMGFFFSGIRPERPGRDWLVLQFLNNRRYAYDQLKAATDFGRELIEYVRDKDPARSI